MVIGVDEAGRGPWAGPLTVCAVGLPNDITIEGLTDSKRLSTKRREDLAVAIKQKAAFIAIAWRDAAYIDQNGLSVALRTAVTQVVASAAQANPRDIIIDGSVNFAPEFGAVNMVKADTCIPAVSAASIIAKVTRDNYMCRIARRYRQHGFERHKGYGTDLHVNCLDRHGVTNLHRRSFRPIAELAL